MKEAERRGFIGQIGTPAEQKKPSSSREIGAPAVHAIFGMDSDLAEIERQLQDQPGHIQAAVVQFVRTRNEF